MAEVIEPSEIDTSRVGVGTKVWLGGAEPRVLTILGPWDAEPDHGVYSYQAPIAEALLGKVLGETVTVQGASYTIDRIALWTE